VEYLDRFLDYESTYYYYITAIDFSNNESEASNTLNIQPLNISAPQPPSNFKVNPTNNPLAGKEDISLTWLPPDASDLNKYIIYRSTEEDFIPSNETLLSSTTTTFYIDNDAIINQKYYYRVTAVDNGLKESYPSLIESDSILSTPNLILPSNSTIFSTPYLFRWDEVLDAVSYEVFVGTAPLSTIIWSSGKTTLKETTYDGPPLQYNKVYYWWVVTYSKTGSANPNSYSIANSFFAE
jgi:hypothetical protein